MAEKKTDRAARAGEERDESAGTEPADEGAVPEPEPEGEGHEEVTLSYAEYEELKTLAAERDDYLRRLQRAVADYQNLQKRVEKFQQSARESVLRTLGENILPVADSLSLALEAAEQTEGAENIVEGLEMVNQSFYEALKQIGIRPIEAIGKDFDPDHHEAVMQQRLEGIPQGRVVRELKKGFQLEDQVIRPSQVVVSGPPPEGTEPEE
ncbi:MAG: nucleotide exchange factor GrpE [Planctomycetota bacterium]